nr:cell envelope integrity protein TolA [Microvirga terricola]
MKLKFNSSEPGFWVSGVGHVLLIAGALIGLSSFHKLPEAEEGIPVEVITDNQLSQITKGDKTAKEVQPTPKPRVERVADKVEERDPGEDKRDTPAPPKRPDDMKVADKEEPVASQAPPPTPPSKPAEVKAEEERKLIEKAEAEALEQAKAAAAKAKAEAEAQAKAKAEAEAKAKAKAEAEAKAKADAEAKRIADAKAKAEAEAKARKEAELAKKLDLSDIRKMLDNKEKNQSSGSTGAEVNKAPSLGTQTGTAAKLSPSMLDALKGDISQQLHNCWNPPVASQTAANPPVATVRIRLNQDGSLSDDPAVLNNNSADTLFRSVADSAIRAARKCSPLKINARYMPYYEDWKSLVINFDPRDV